MLGVTLDAFEPVEDGLLEAGGAFGGEAETFVEVTDTDGEVRVFSGRLGVFHRVFHRFRGGF